MKKICAFSGSASSNSINQQLVTYAAGLSSQCDKEVIHLKDYPMPLYSADEEENSGVPENASKLLSLMQECEGFIISVPEYNGVMPAVFKNTVDWISRVEKKVFAEKPLIVMATSPGPRGAITSLEHLNQILPRWGANVVGSFSLPSFPENFNEGVVTDGDKREELNGLIEKLESAIME